MTDFIETSDCIVKSTEEAARWAAKETQLTIAKGVELIADGYRDGTIFDDTVEDALRRLAKIIRDADGFTIASIPTKEGFKQ